MNSFGLTNTNLTASCRSFLRLSSYLLSQQTSLSILVSPAEWLLQIAFSLSELRKALYSASPPSSQERRELTLPYGEMCTPPAQFSRAHHLRIPAFQGWLQGIQNPRHRLSTRSSRSTPATCRSHFLSSPQYASSFPKSPRPFSQHLTQNENVGMTSPVSVARHNHGFPVER